MQRKRCSSCGGLLTTTPSGGEICLSCALSAGVKVETESNADISKDETGDLQIDPSVVRYFGDYEIIGKIGSGGMGVVYRARQVSLNRVVALKIIQPALVSDLKAVERFRFEAEAVGRLDHCNIVSLFEVGTVGGSQYYSMQLVNGEDLEESIRNPTKSEQRLHYRQIALTVIKLARAIQYAHSHGVLHRDIKPSNIVIDGNGEPFIFDFGLAKLLKSKGRITAPGTVLGTPAYMQLLAALLQGLLALLLL